MARQYDESVKTGLRSKLTSYGDDEFSLFLRKAFIKGAGYTDDALERPIIGLIDTSSGFNPCHGNVPALLQAVERSVLLAGALPVKFPTISLHESFASPTSMYLRNLMSVDTEEMIKAQPMDGVVLIGGCDKTVPAQLMGAISANIPCISLVTGPMLTGSYEGRRVGACTDCRSYWKDYRAGIIDIEDITRVNDELVPSVGTCGVMGTASTMACLLEALGMAPLGSATATAPSSARLRIAAQVGSLIVRNSLASEAPLRPQDILSRESFENAITVLHAIGGSTNAIVHLLAIAGRIPGLGPTELNGITLDVIDEIGKRTPLLVDLKPSGDGYMEDFHRAGGVPALLSVLAKGNLLHLDARTVEALTLGAALAGHPAAQRHGLFQQSIIRPLSDPIYPCAALVVLRGNLAPSGCVLKASAASSNLLKHRGPVLIFRSAADLAARIDSPDLPVTPETLLVMQGTGPVGHPGMPEAGLIPIPKKLAAQGVKDMLRVSDARMSGTAQGTVVLHVTPEAAVGGPLALVHDGDIVGIDVEERKIWMEVSDEELEERKRKWDERNAKIRKMKKRGYGGLYERTVLQADLGADFDWLTATYERESET
ncbi:dihydroxy-acid and 6-phosphogluconate dehydratase [Fomitiporia mediterranea MF3/22]|uniref:dihydroxy-acid and 6-phosphogluconate dehydratase n=1 Tax=Fomitiporia mediterranea (strain MF3/22) TaxID=694068 RepID=UPI00044088C0|nr:dihydroxy-acid and 6-phosphogluconate dehydratase [Fomitiporia mediterranea MF3/22]EJD07087.1 dihydroxy-acid and 6-phosphogluconate dehydratase [Fomitiporia mediterranea MF3/22]